MNMKNIFDKAIGLLFGIVFAVVFCVLVFFHEYTRFSFHFIFSNLVLFIFALVFLLICKKILKKKEFKYEKFIFYFLILGMFLFEYLLLKTVLFQSGWDVGLVMRSAYENVQNHVFNSNKFYFETYPNNLLLLFYEMFIALFVNFVGKDYLTFNFILAFINVVIFVISGILLYFCIKKATDNNRISLIGLFVYIILVGSSGWVLIPYSDSIGIFFPTVLLFLFLFLKKKKFLMIMIVSLISFVSFHIKPQLFIMFIAFVIVYFFNMFFDKKIKDIFLSSLIVVGSFLVINYGYSLLEHKVQLDNDKSLGISHFLMMGFNYEQNGVYSEDDINFSRSFTDPDVRKKENLKVLKSRIYSYGPFKLIQHFKNKILVNFDDGNFFFGEEGTFYDYIYFENSKGFKFLSKFVYSNGKYYKYIATIRQLFWIFILMLLPINLCGNNTNELLIAKLSLIGLLLFELLFEARSRYLFCYVPIFIFVAMYQMYCLFCKK